MSGTAMHPSYQECIDTAACPVCHAPAGIWCGTGQDLHVGRIHLYNREYPDELI